jgi:hypothetical protein
MAECARAAVLEAEVDPLAAPTPGKINASRRCRGAWQRFRHGLRATLIHLPSLSLLANLAGSFAPTILF